MKPPDFSKADLDWSRFHPMMHPVFSKECFGWYGGPVQHVRLVLEFAPNRYRFGWLLDTHYIWHRVTGCWWGRHDLGEVWKKDGTITGYHCFWCPENVKHDPDS